MSRVHPSKVVEIRKCETWVGNLPIAMHLEHSVQGRDLIFNFTLSYNFDNFFEGCLPPITRIHPWASTLYSIYNINAYMALTLDILSLVNNIKIIEFSKICWIGLEFFLVYIYLNYNIYIHTCDTFIPVKIYI